jgi:hypothetical protein
MALHNSLPFGNDPRIASYFAGDTKVWESLRKAITESSGFQRWKIERNSDQQFQSLSLDTQAHTYLRETLETLAY